jgi:hypothetical protein
MPSCDHRQLENTIISGKALVLLYLSYCDMLWVHALLLPVSYLIPAVLSSASMSARRSACIS